MNDIDRLRMDDWVSEVVEYLPISKTYKNKLVSVSRQPSKRNRFWTEFIEPNLIVEQLDQHVPIHETKMSSFSLKGSKKAKDEVASNPDQQAAYPWFSNPLRIPAYGPEFPRGDKRFCEDNERPKDRATVSEFWAFTFEWDSSEPDALMTQLEWVWKKDSDGRTPLEKLDRYLRQNFRDYRGIVCVWSGHKSVHINLVFDPSHMQKQAMIEICNLRGRSPEARIRDHWNGDIRPDAIWEYHKQKWLDLIELLKQHAGIYKPFDANLQPLFQKRRTPWGLNLASEDNIFGVPEGQLIPQVVVYEKLITSSPKGAKGYFLNSQEANSLPTTVPSRHRTVQMHDPSEFEPIMDPLRDLLKNQWRSEYPKPSHIGETTDGALYLYFHNDENDQNPSTVVGQHHNRLLHRGKGKPLTDETKFLPGYQSLNDLLSLLIEALQPSEIPIVSAHRRRRGLSIPTRQFESAAIDGGIPGIRRGVSMAAMTASMDHPRLVIMSVEGAGKSTALIRGATDFQFEDYIENYHGGQNLVTPENGFSIVACGSNEQAKEHYDAYVKWRHEIGEPVNAVHLKSFSTHYQEYCEANSVAHEDQTSWLQSLEMGYGTQIDAVAVRDPSAYAAIEKAKNDAWTIQVKDRNGHISNRCGFQCNMKTLIFTTKALAQKFNEPTKSKAWLHPDFSIDMKNDEWIELAKQFRAYRIIHDEISLSDLVATATEDEVRITRAFQRKVEQKCNDTWRNISNDQRYSVYKSFDTKISFGRLMNIAEHAFKDEDRTTVDFDELPFGRDNTENGIYNATTGEVIYVRQQDWWAKVRARVVMTTTERMVAEITKKLLGPDQKRSFKVEEWDSQQVFQPDPIELRPDTRACSKEIQNLADELKESTDHTITDIAKLGHTISHDSARGRNDLTNKRLATILTFISPEQYAIFNAISQELGIPELIQHFYLDRINQAAGRNRGLRNPGDPSMTHAMYVAPTLIRELGGVKFFAANRYPAYLVTNSDSAAPLGFASEPKGPA